MKIFKRIFGALSSLAMMVAPVVASGAVGAVTPGAAPYTTDNTKVTITKQVNDVTNSVNNTFSYIVTPDNTNNPATITLPANLASFTIPFVNVTPVNMVAEQTKTLDFSTVDFPKVGDYYFKISEPTTGWSTDTDNVYPRDTDEWYAYVSVRYVTDGSPTQVSGTPTTTMRATVSKYGTLTKDAPPVNPTNPALNPGDTGYDGNKDDITFDTKPDMTYIELEKKVTGNLGDITKYFEYTINLGAAMASTATETKKVTILDRDGNGFSINGTSNTSATPAVGDSATVNVDTDGNIKLWLKHNQAVQIGLTAALPNGKAQIPVKVNTTTNTSYTITEKIDPADSFYPKLAYTVYIDANTVKDEDGAITKTVSPIPDATDAAAVAAFNANNKTKYTNNKEADPITGFFVNYWPFVLLIALGILGFFIIKKTSKKEQ